MSFQGKVYTKGTVCFEGTYWRPFIHLIILDIIALCSTFQFLSIIYLPLSSTIVTVIWLWSPISTLLGREEGLIVRVNDSGASNKLSLMIWTFNKALILSAGIVTLNGPET